MKHKMLFNLSVSLGLLLGMNTLQAAEVQWLEGGNAVHATQDELKPKNAGSSDPVEATLGTGVVVTLTGGVYAKADDVSVVLAWALTNNYVALEDEFIPNAVNIQTTPEQSIEVANAVAGLEGVTTAMPNYRIPMVPK